VRSIDANSRMAGGSRDSGIKGIGQPWGSLPPEG
jgi:hypothetical protein